MGDDDDGDARILERIQKGRLEVKRGGVVRLPLLFAASSELGP